MYNDRLKGEAYGLRAMKVKADKAGTIESQAHNNPGGYLYWSMIGNPSVTTSWQEYTKTGVISASQAGMNTIAFNLSPNKTATTFYFDDIYFEKQESGNTIPLTPKEKADTLTWAMDKWVKGMMQACGGYVKSCNNTFICCIPAFYSYFFRSFTKSKVSLFNQFKTICFKKQRTIFSRFFAISTPNTYSCILR